MNNNRLTILTLSSLLAILPLTIAGCAATTTEVSQTPTAGVRNPDLPDAPPAKKVRRSRDRTGPPSYGPKDAKVHVIVFSDFQCPVCPRVKDATHQIAAEFPGDVRLEFWNSALESHPHAENAAAAGIAAQAQGKFWEMHDLMFENSPALDRASLESYAESLGLDMKRFSRDMDDPETRERVHRESAVAQAVGATGTPGIAVNGRVSVGWASWNMFRRMVERELIQANKLSDQGLSPAEVHEQRAESNMEDSETYRHYYEAIILDAADR